MEYQYKNNNLYVFKNMKSFDDLRGKSVNNVIIRDSDILLNKNFKYLVNSILIPSLSKNKGKIILDLYK